MNKDTLGQLAGVIIGLLIGIGATYSTLKVDDAVLNTRVSQLEASSRQHQSDINILRVEVSKVNTEIKNTDQSYRLLRTTLKEVANSNKDIAIALTRLEERQARTDKILERFVEEKNR